MSSRMRLTVLLIINLRQQYEIGELFINFVRAFLTSPVLCRFKLTVIKICVKSVLSHEGIMIALFYYLAVLHDEYYVRALYRRESVRDYEARSALGHFRKRVLNFQLRTRID